MMHALRFHGQRDIRLEEVVIPQPTPAEVRIRVTNAGICQTQINEFVEGPYLLNSAPHPRTGLSMPIIAGHEFGGIIDAIGDEVHHSHLLGELVAVLPLLSCGTCEFCREHRENLCDSMAYYGLLGANGGFAEYAVVNAENLFPVENPALVTFIEPILVAINAARKVEDSLAGSKVLIIGSGTLGLAMQAVFQDYFHANVTGTDILPQRFARAKSAGFRVVSQDELTEKYDIVVDCAGSNPISIDTVFSDCRSRIRKGGVLLSIGTYFHPISVIPSDLLVSELRIITSYMYTSTDVRLLPDVLRSLQVDFSSLIETIPLSNIIPDGYYRAEVDKDSFTRLVVAC